MFVKIGFFVMMLFEKWFVVLEVKVISCVGYE